MTAASRPAGLALLALVVLVGCGTAADRREITALVGRFMAFLAPGSGGSPPEDWADVFFGIDGAASPATRLESIARDRTYGIDRIRLLPFGTATVTVELRGGADSSTLEIRARKIRGEWRLDPSIRVKQKLADVPRSAP